MLFFGRYCSKIAAFAPQVFALFPPPPGGGARRAGEGGGVGNAFCAQHNAAFNPNTCATQPPSPQPSPPGGGSKFFAPQHYLLRAG